LELVVISSPDAWTGADTALDPRTHLVIAVGGRCLRGFPGRAESADPLDRPATSG